MKRLLIVSGMMMLLAACGATSMVEESASEGPVLGTMENSLEGLQCGSGCGEGQYVSYYGCYPYENPSCGACSYGAGGFNKVSCLTFPSGGGFDACGFNTYANVSANLYISNHMYSWDCAVDDLDSNKFNRTYYSVIPTNANQQFYKCGIGCPSGYLTLGYYASENCGTGPADNIEKTVSLCRVSSSSAMWACGTTCPSGYTTQAYGYNSNCRPSNSSPTDVDNQVYCVPSGS